MANFTLTITEWNKDKGFGFGSHQGQRFFVHTTAIEPRQKRGADLTKLQVVVTATKQGQKGLAVETAYTLPEWEGKEARRIEAERQRAAMNAEHEAKTAVANTWWEQNRQLAVDRALVLIKPLKYFSPITEEIEGQGVRFNANTVFAKLQNEVSVTTPPVARYSFSVRVDAGGSFSESVSYEDERQGWQWVKASAESTSDWKGGEAKCEVTFEFVDAYMSKFKLMLPVTVHEPVFDGLKGMQLLEVHCPNGQVLTRTLELTHHGKSQAWGGFSKDSVLEKSKAAEKAVVKAAVDMEAPTCELVHVVYEWIEREEPLTKRGEVWSKYPAGGIKRSERIASLAFMFKSELFSNEKYNFHLSIMIGEDLNFAEVERRVRDYLIASLSNANINRHELTLPLVEKLFGMVMDTIPKYSEEDEVIFVDQDDWSNAEKAKQANPGQVVVGKDKYARLRYVLPKEVADCIGVEGELKQGMKVFWRGSKPTLEELFKKEFFEQTELRFVHPYFPGGTRFEARLEPGKDGYIATAIIPAQVWKNVLKGGTQERQMVGSTMAAYTFPVKFPAGVFPEGELYGNVTLEVVEANRDWKDHYVVVLPDKLPAEAWQPASLRGQREQIALELWEEYKRVRRGIFPDGLGRCYISSQFGLNANQVWLTGNLHTMAKTHGVDVAKYVDPAADLFGRDYTIKAEVKELATEDYEVHGDKFGTKKEFWCISQSGDLVAPNRRNSNGKQTDYFWEKAPANCLVISRHENGGYGYRLSVTFEVHNLPESISTAQHEVVENLLVQAEKWGYFVGPTCRWDLSKVGIVTFTTERTFGREDLKEFTDAIFKGSVNPAEYAISSERIQADPRISKRGGVVHTVYPTKATLVTPTPMSVISSATAESMPFEVTDIKGAWYKCRHCGRADNLKGKQREAFKNGEEVKVVCGDERCKAPGTVKKP